MISTLIILLKIITKHEQEFSIFFTLHSIIFFSFFDNIYHFLTDFLFQFFFRLIIYCLYTPTGT